MLRTFFDVIFNLNFRCNAKNKHFHFLHRKVTDCHSQTAQANSQKIRWMVLTTIQPQVKRSKRSSGWEGKLAGERKVHRTAPTTSAQHATEREVDPDGGRDNGPPVRCETRQTRMLVGGSNRQSTRYQRDFDARREARTTGRCPGRQRLNRDPRGSRK